MIFIRKQENAEFSPSDETLIRNELQILRPDWRPQQDHTRSSLIGQRKVDTETREVFEDVARSGEKIK